MPDGEREVHRDPINVPVTKVRLTDCAPTGGSAAFIARIAKLITAIPIPSDTMASRVKPMIDTSEDATVPKTRRRIRRTAECTSKALGEGTSHEETIASADGTA